MVLILLGNFVRSASKLPFFGKIGHTKFVGFQFYSAI